jgi:hypothetical protein
MRVWDRGNPEGEKDRGCTGPEERRRGAAPVVF